MHATTWISFLIGFNVLEMSMSMIVVTSITFDLHVPIQLQESWFVQVKRYLLMATVNQHSLYIET